MEYSYGRGFRLRLEEAMDAWNETRSELFYQDSAIGNSNDLVVVDYSTFKQKIKKYSQRRINLKQLLDGKDPTTLISDDAVASILYFPEDSNKPHIHSIPRFRKRPQSATVLSDTGDCYLPMTDVDGACNSERPGILKKRKRVKYRRDVMREVSGLEREGVEFFIAEEIIPISQIYRKRRQFLRFKFLEWRTKIWQERDQMYLPTRDNSDKSTGSDLENDIVSNANPAIIQETLRLGKALLDLEAFCVLNILVVRQTLHSYDAFARSFEGTPMMEFYLKSVLKSKMPHKKQKSPNLYRHELREILLHKEIRDLSLEFARNLDWLCLESEAEETSTNAWADTKAILESIAHRFQQDIQELRRLVLSSSTIDEKDFLANNNRFESKKATTTSAEASIATPLENTFMNAVARKFFIGVFMEEQFGWYLDTHSRGKSLAEEMKALTKWKRKSDEMWSFLGFGTMSLSKSIDSSIDNGCGMGQTFLQGLECADADEWRDEGDKDETKNDRQKPNDSTNKIGPNGITDQQKFNLIMALTAGFLYCMNYYIVEPSSTMYVNALGAHDAAGAALIGMMPIASFLAAIVYSIWTNTVFRQPFLVSCSLMVIGNIIYASALNYQSLAMALIGRFLTGLGGPKMIVRRYMADTTSVSIRTSVNAGFGMVVAAGSALGPGCAILLSNFNFAIQLPYGSKIYFNSMTGPGWFMAILWSVFSIALFCGFQEQERIGLTEKLAQEMLGKDNSSSATLHEQEQEPTIVSSRTDPSECQDQENPSLWNEIQHVSRNLSFPVRLCLGLLFAKVFVIETLVSCTSALSKNRYRWTIHEVGLLGCANGFSVIPISFLVGRLSLYYQDRYLMVWLLSMGMIGLCLLVDVTDLSDTSEAPQTYNRWLFWSVGPSRYVSGYFVTYLSIQSFEGVIGSALSKLIPTALAQGTFNSGLLATLVDTFGRSCGDLFISLMGFWNIRQLMNLLFLPGVMILGTCLIFVRKFYDLLAV